MPQATDIVINGAGYMVDPGSYKRAQEGMPEGRTERIALTDFFGGQRRALQLERDRFATSLAVGPALDGQGVRPWAPRWDTTIAALTGTFPHRDRRVPSVIVRDRIYIAVGKTLYRGTPTAPDMGWSWAVEKTYTWDITDLCIYSSFGMLIAFGGAADMLFRNTLTLTEVVLMTGERAHSLAPYAGLAVWTDARPTTRPTLLRLAHRSGIDERKFDYDPIALASVGAELVLATKQSIYRFSGRPKKVMVNNPAYTVGGTQPPQIPSEEWSGELTPFFQNGMYTDRDDFSLLVSYGGKIIAWIANGVHEHTPGGDRAGWRYTGLSGRRCFGGCVAAGYVIVAMESHDGRNEVWAYDGNGWWRLMEQAARAPGTTGTWCWPTAIGSGAVHRNVMIFTEGSNAVVVLRLAESRTDDAAYSILTDHAPTAELVTPLIDAHQRDKPKAWRKIGCTFASPELRGMASSTDGIIVYLDYSTDAGSTWTQAATSVRNGNTLANNNFELTASISGATSTFLMVRVRWASVEEWAPILVGLWAEYEILHSPARRRKWTFKVHARDQEIDRDGKLLTRTGRQLIAELWSAWQGDTVVSFRDLDYDADPTQRNVRITGISEAVAQPSDAAEWGDSLITLNLVDV